METCWKHEPDISKGRESAKKVVDVRFLLSKINHIIPSKPSTKLCIRPHASSCKTRHLSPPTPLKNMKKRNIKIRGFFFKECFNCNLSSKKKNANIYEGMIHSAPSLSLFKATQNLGANKIS